MMESERMNTNQNETSEKTQPGPKVVTSGKKVKHFSKRIIGVTLFLFAGIIAAITFQAHFNPVAEVTRQERTYHPPQQAAFADLAASMRQDRANKIPVQVENVAPQPAPEKQPQKIVIEDRRPAQPTRAPLPRYHSNQNDAQAANMLRDMRLKALTAKPVVDDFARMDVAASTPRSGGSEGMNGGLGADGGFNFDPTTLSALMQQQPGQQDANGQNQKQNFLRGKDGGGALTPQGYSESLPIPRQFEYELKAGTIIPGLMLTGLNSDLPGNVLAQVSENVWDVAGKHVLIPKGTRVIGVYDSQATFGQSRVLLVWNRLVMPNGTTLDIAGSPGVDQAGYSGLSGRVNEHWGRMFKSALLASIFVAGTEMVYGDDTSGNSSNNNEKKTPRDVAAESLAGSILDMGTKIMNKTSDIQPTITVKPGKKMGIFVQQDVVFPFPYM